MSLTNDDSSNWEVIFSPTADKQFGKLDASVQRSIKRYILTHLTIKENPRRFGKPLSGNLKEFWSYRVGDYRLICELHDHIVTITVVKVGHRKEVY